jgi:putative nucleotidyltransferase with HDIG domain
VQGTKEGGLVTAVEFVEDLGRLPAQPAAALKVLRLVEDPRSSSADLARLIEADPVLSARVMRLANAPYYGLSRKVGSASRAVVLLGFSTVRALAVSAACSLLNDDASLGPAGFWSHSVATAAAASVVAGEIGAPAGEAFSCGLLHDIGVALLFRRDRSGYLAAATGPEVTSASSFLAAEADAFGLTHTEAGAAALEAWRFPPAFVRAVADHHNAPERVGNSLGRLVVAGQALAGMLGALPPHVPPTEIGPALEAVGLAPDASRRLALEARREIEDLGRTLGVRP